MAMSVSCPLCVCTVELTANSGGKQDTTGPAPGDHVLCHRCGCISLMVDSEGTTRCLTRAELERLPPSFRRVASEIADRYYAQREQS